MSTESERPATPERRDLPAGETRKGDAGVLRRDLAAGSPSRARQFCPSCGNVLGTGHKPDCDA